MTLARPELRRSTEHDRGSRLSKTGGIEPHPKKAGKQSTVLHPGIWILVLIIVD